MATYQTKSSRFAIVSEVTEGTPVTPTAATQYIALQEGFELTPNIDVLENAELTGSLGPAKSILGLEQPEGSLDHYLRHSGVEGQAPNFGLLVESALGDKSVNATEYDTIGGSTAGTSSVAATVVVDTGEGANFERGEALLIKDSTNGYSVRNVKSISSDTLTLNFNLGSAPASGVNLGKAVLYKPGNNGPTFTAWDYRGNGAAVGMVPGNKISEMSVEANTGEFVNASFSFQGLEYFFNPIEITASTDTLDFNDGSDKSVTIPADFYKDPHELAAQVQTLMDAASAYTITCTYSDSTGKFTISSNGGSPFNLEWNTGANTAQTIGGKLGFVTTSDDTGSTSYTSDNAITLTSTHTPTFDSADPVVAKNAEVTLGGFDDYSCFCTATLSMSLTNELVDVPCACAESGVQATVKTARAVTIELSGSLPQYDAEKFHRFHTNQTTSFMANFGEKSGSNWVAGKVVNMYVPTATISAFNMEDSDGLVFINMTLTAFVESGLGEVYINFL